MADSEGEVVGAPPGESSSAVRGRHAPADPARTSPRRWDRWLVAVLVVVCVLGLGWFTYTALQVKKQSTALEQTLTSAKTHAKSLDTTALAGDLSTMRDQASSIESLSSGPIWAIAGQLPWIGDNVSAVQTVADAVNGVAQSTVGLDALLPQLSPTQLRAPDGRLNVATLTQAAPIFAKVAAALAAAQAQVDGISDRNLVSQVSSAVTRAQSSLDGTPTTVKLLTVLPALLGSDQPQTYAVLLLNPSELRGGGGFFGGYALLTSDKGKVTLDGVGEDATLAATGPLDVSAMPADYRALWGASAPEWQSVNISPHFPYAAQLTVSGFAKLGTHVDGVIALDSKVAAALLAGTGPVTADGVTISSANADAYFTKGIYAQFPVGTLHRKVALDLLDQMFVKLTTSTIDVKSMASALVPLAGERRLLAWSSLPAAEAVLAALPIGGLLPDAPGPWTSVALVNGSGNKMDAYLMADVAYLAKRCTTSSTPSTLTLTLANVAPESLPTYTYQRVDDPSAPKGSTLVLAYVYGPTGSTLEAATLDGKLVGVQSGVERGHPVWRFNIAVLRGQSETLVVKFREPAGSDGFAPVVMAQPMEITETTSATLVPCTTP